MKKKGFTLVELLGVIVVLAIIALIAIPTIIGIIDKSRKSSLQNSGYGLVEAGTLYYAHYQNFKTIRFDIKNNNITTKDGKDLTYKGNIKEGTILINHKGEVVICINDGKYAAYKNFKENKVTIVDNKTCTIPENSNIVYLDKEATMDTNLEDLITRIEALENENKTQKEKIEKLENEKSNQIDVTTSINNLTSMHNTDITILNNKLGNTNIPPIGSGSITGSGDGTITGAIQSLNNLVSKNDMLFYASKTGQPWLAIKENWDSISLGFSSGLINSGQDFGFFFYKLNHLYGVGLIVGYTPGCVWHIYGGEGNFYYESLSISSGPTKF